MDALERMRETIRSHNMASSNTAVVLMVSGGSDSVALAYLAADLLHAGELGALAMVHVNHKLRGQASDADAHFVAHLADALSIPLFSREIDIAARAADEGANIEAIARRERYGVAAEALQEFASSKWRSACIFTAHTVDDRIENFYMRSIVGTGPGGFRSMRYVSGSVARPLLDIEREDLRRYIQERAEQGAVVARDEEGALWREDATNADTTYFRAYVRHKIVPLAKARNPKLAETLSRTMNLIADEDDMLEEKVLHLEEQYVVFQNCGDTSDQTHVMQRTVFPRDFAELASCVIAPKLGEFPLPLIQRLITRVLHQILGWEARIEMSSVLAIADAWENAGSRAAKVRGGYVVNIQGNLAVSANKSGVRIEPMEAFRIRRGKR